MFLEIIITCTTLYECRKIFFSTFQRNILCARYLFRFSSDVLREMPTGCRWRCPGNPLRTVFPWQESSRFRLASQIPPGKFSPTVCLNGCWSRKRGIVRRVHAGCASFLKNTIITIIVSAKYELYILFILQLCTYSVIVHYVYYLDIVINNIVQMEHRI